MYPTKLMGFLIYSGYSLNNNKKLLNLKGSARWINGEAGVRAEAVVNPVCRD
jgi:hypothetical protein